MMWLGNKNVIPISKVFLKNRYFFDSRGNTLNLLYIEFVSTNFIIYSWSMLIIYYKCYNSNNLLTFYRNSILLKLSNNEYELILLTTNVGIHFFYIGMEYNWYSSLKNVMTYRDIKIYKNEYQIIGQLVNFFYSLSLCDCSK